MPDIFDEVASEAPKGDIFDQLASENFSSSNIPKSLGGFASPDTKRLGAVAKGAEPPSMVREFLRSMASPEGGQATSSFLGQEIKKLPGAVADVIPNALNSLASYGKPTTDAQGRVHPATPQAMLEQQQTPAIVKDPIGTIATATPEDVDNQVAPALLGGVGDVAIKAGGIAGAPKAALRQAAGIGDNVIDVLDKQQQAKIAETAQKQSARAQLVQQHEQLMQQADAKSLQLHERVKTAEATERQRLNGEFGQVKEAVGDQPIDMTPVENAVVHARDNIVQGSPDSLKAFNEILKGQTDSMPKVMGSRLDPTNPAHMQLIDRLRTEGAIPASSPSTFADAHGFYTELGEKIAAGNLPGDVYRAAKYVRDAIGKQVLDPATEAAGVGEQWQAAKSDWGKFMDSFHNTKAISSGGSPVAHALRAADPAFMREPLIGKASARAKSILANYDPQAAKMAGDIQDTVKQAKQLPSTLRPGEQPQGLTREQLRQQVLDSQVLRLGKTISPFDVLPGLGQTRLTLKRAAGKAISNPSLRNWLSREK